VAEQAAVVLLERGERVRLEPVAAGVAAKALSRLEPGFDLLDRESAEAIAAVTAAGAWRLSLTRDPAAAIEVLVDHFSVGAAAAPSAG
jgi:flavin-dependent dehydrogenase